MSAQDRRTLGVDTPADARPPRPAPGRTRPHPGLRPAHMIRAMPDLTAALQTVVTRCLAIREGEDVLVIVDAGTRSIGEALRVAAAAMGADSVLTVMDERATDGTEPPRPVAAALAACDVFIVPTSRSLSHTNQHTQASEAGARGATLPGVTEEMLARAMAIDFDLKKPATRSEEGRQ